MCILNDVNLVLLTYPLPQQGLARAQKLLTCMSLKDVVVVQAIAVFGDCSNWAWLRCPIETLRRFVLNCCCKQQRRRGVTWFKLLLRAAETLRRHVVLNC